jgi:SAM-dependent methyltransferase
MLGMRSDVLQTLRRVNDSFYQTFGEPFAETRQRLQPGVLRSLDRLQADASVLDLGCGNGGVARHLLEQGQLGSYLGVDNSPVLLAQAAATVEDPRIRFLEVDLIEPDWEARLADQLSGPSRFDRVLCFAVLHHIPGREARIALLRAVRRLLETQGQLHLSTWDFLSSPRLQARIMPWEELGLTAGDVDPGDYLLDWRRGGTGLRYVHHFTQDELQGLARETDFEVLETYSSDGENGRLGVYQAWRAAGAVEMLPGA